MNVLEIENVFEKEQNLDLKIAKLNSNSKQNLASKFSNLKTRFLSLQQKAEFLKNLTSFSTNNTSPTLKDLSTIKAKITDTQNQILTQAEETISQLNNLNNSKQSLINIVLAAREIELQYNNALELQLNDEELLKLIDSNNQYDSEITNLNRNLSQKVDKLNSKKSQIDKKKAELNNLLQSKTDAEKRESEAIRLSNAQDPRIKELSTWFLNSKDLLYEINDIIDIQVTDSQIVVNYTAYSVLFKLGKNMHSVVAILVDGVEMFTELLQNIQNEFIDLEQQLAFLVVGVKHRMDLIKKRLLEFQGLIDNGAIYDHQNLQMLVPVDTRVFVFKIDFSYPSGKF